MVLGIKEKEVSLAHLPSVATPIEHGASLRDRVEQALSAAITSGEMPPGQVYSAPALSQLFNVSATPVREAMLNLEKRGFVEVLRNKGFRVTEIGKSELQQIVDVRLLLEPPSMKKVAAVFPRHREREFRALAQEIIDTAAAEDLAGYLAADKRFHLELLALLGNDRLVEAVERLRSQTRIVGLADILKTAELEAWAKEHDLLVDLLVRGDGGGAEKLLGPHIQHIVKVWKPANP